MSDPSTFHWTYEDYVRLTEGEEYFEFIEGRAVRRPDAHDMASDRRAVTSC